MIEVVVAGAGVGSPVFVGLIVALPTLVLGYLGYRRTEKLDMGAAQAHALQAQSATVQQVIDGLNVMAENLQADNRVLRKYRDDCSERVRKLSAAYAELQKQLNGDGA